MGAPADWDSREHDRAEDLRFMRRDWRAQRFGWMAIAVCIALALAGAFGRGPLASTEVRQGVNGSALTVRFDRVMRHEARATLEVMLPAAARRATNETVTIALDKDLTDRLRIERVVPEPERERVQAERVLYEVALGAEGGAVRFEIKPERIGRARGRVGVEAHEVEVDGFVLP